MVTEDDPYDNEDDPCGNESPFTSARTSEESNIDFTQPPRFDDFNEDDPCNNESLFSLASTYEESNVDSTRPPGFDDYPGLKLEIVEALRALGIDCSRVIIGLDFTLSNQWSGKASFNNESLHAIADGDTLNPYQQVIHSIENVMGSSDDDYSIPCFGFGDVTTRDEGLFSFRKNCSPCHGFKEVSDCYRMIILPNVQLSGPTAYAKMVEHAVDIVEESGGKYHILVIITCGQVIPGSQQEQETIKSVVDASSYPLSIVFVGVGDGPWENIRKFGDKIPARKFDNFQFVDFTVIMSRHATTAEKEMDFACAALMNIPFQYRAAVELGIVSRTTGRKMKIAPQPPPVLLPHCTQPEHRVLVEVAQAQLCGICYGRAKDLAFGCGHMSCRECGWRISQCHNCRVEITSRLQLFF